MAQRFTRPGALYGCHGTKRSLALLCLQDGEKDVHSGQDITFARENERERGQKNGKGRPEGGREGWKFRGCVFESKAEKEFKCVYLTHRSPPSPTEAPPHLQKPPPPAPNPWAREGLERGIPGELPLCAWWLPRHSCALSERNPTAMDIAFSHIRKEGNENVVT